MGKQNNWKNRWKALFYGPGWDEGKPRLDDPSDIPEIPGDKSVHFVYDPPQDNSVKIY